MEHERATYAYIGALVDGLARAGIAHVCLCPGSRSTPLAISAARHPAIRTWTLIDERSAGFFALGMAKASRAPVALLSTSGTAAANFLPAVVEARYGRVPLVVLTADRPHELRDCGANQTIDQLRLFGVHAKWFADLALPEGRTAALRYARSIASQAVAGARDAPPGPVHLNVPLREPLMPFVGAEFPTGSEPTASGLEGPTAYSAGPRFPDPGTIARLAAECTRLRRGLIVCGPSDDPALPAAVVKLADTLGYPVLADPLSQVRCGSHDRILVIDSYDAFLRVDAAAAALIPEIIIRTGSLPASRPLQQYLQRHAHGHVVIAQSGWDDPPRLAAEMIHADPRLACDALLAAVKDRAHASSSWSASWIRLGQTARQVITKTLEGIEEPFEGKVFAELSTLLGDGAILYVGNSMPVRDLEAFFPGVSPAVRFLGNRGASGIDGLVSSALGAAAASSGPVVLVLGDLAFYHDLNGLLAAKLHSLKGTIVVLNNDGGGIFSFMPQVNAPEHFETLFGTPTGLDFKVAAEMYGAGFARTEDWEAFRRVLRSSLTSERLQIVEMRTERARNVALHRRVWAAVEDAISADDALRAADLTAR